MWTLNLLGSVSNMSAKGMKTKLEKWIYVPSSFMDIISILWSCYKRKLSHVAVLLTYCVSVSPWKWSFADHAQWKKEGQNFVVACFFTFSTTFCIMRFHMHVVVAKWRQRNVPNRLMHRVQNDYFSLVFIYTIPDSFSCRYEKIRYSVNSSPKCESPL